ncbi:MAG TPA: ribosomal protein S18-alanine N-acetyltransferase [Burkholderiaceae bacterium]|jgi:ribosomal-protein-alanine N-acetyltransferase|nr:ribosomal protein S18-alanine N-acetyltransferase [Burkholderiaceae bacterium]
MSARWRESDREVRQLSPMTLEHLDAVMAIETASHVRPWTRGNFTDALASGYLADVLFDAHDSLVGYCIAVAGAGEMHLLNLSVAPAHRQRGHASFMMRALISRCRAERLEQLWLEVRVSNQGARRLYRELGFDEVGLRPAYYPAPAGKAKARGEDAVLMRMALEAMA